MLTYEARCSLASDVIRLEAAEDSRIVKEAYKRVSRGPQSLSSHLNAYSRTPSPITSHPSQSNTALHSPLTKSSSIHTQTTTISSQNVSNINRNHNSGLRNLSLPPKALRHPDQRCRLRNVNARQQLRNYEQLLRIRFRRILQQLRLLLSGAGLECRRPHRMCNQSI
jgi:hypothetical protein